MQLFDYLEVFYDHRRRHSSVGRMSPASFERKMTQAARPRPSQIVGTATVSPSWQRPPRQPP